MKNHVKVKINGILNNSLFKITMIVLCCLILSTSIIRTDNFINCMFNGLVIFALLINIYHLPIVNDYIKKYKKKWSSSSTITAASPAPAANRSVSRKA